MLQETAPVSHKQEGLVEVHFRIYILHSQQFQIPLILRGIMEISRIHTSNYQSLSHKHWISILQVPPAVSARAQCRAKICINLHTFSFTASSTCGLQPFVVFMQIEFCDIFEMCI